MNSVIGALRVVLGADTAAFEKGMSGAQRTLRKFDRDMQKMAAGFKSIGQTLTVGLTLPILAFGAASVKAAQESADAFAQVEAGLKSMGNASGRTMEQLQASAKALQNMAAIDDDDILRSVTANLLTFGKVSGPVFDRAQVAIVDLATRMKMELQPATLLVGKALNDPIKGLTAMGRAGIQFTAQQKALIKSLVATGQSAKAQEIILGELERQFGGSAKAAADANPYQRLKIAFDELSEVIGEKLTPIILPMVNGLTDLLKRFDTLSPAAQKFALIGGAIAAALGPALIVIGSLISAVGTIAAFMAGPLVAAGAAALVPFAPLIAAAAALVGAFLLFREQIIPVLQQWGKTVSDALGPKIAPLIEAVKAAFTSFVEAVAPLFQPGGILSASLSVFLGFLTRVVSGLTSMIGGALDFLTGIFNAIGALLRGDWSAMWGHLLKAVVGLAKGIGGAFAAMFPEVISWVKKTWEGVKLWLVDKFVGIVKAVSDKIKAVAGFFKSLWDAVVGHSYIPDMVEGIAEWMAKLDAAMVQPARNATDKVKRAFEELRADLASIMEGLLTDQERAARDLAKVMATIAKGEQQGLLTPAEAAAARRRAEARAGVGHYGDVQPGAQQGGPRGQSNDPIQRGRHTPGAANDHGAVGSVPMAKWGGSVFSPEAVADMREKFIGFGKDLANAIRTGNLPEFFESLAAKFADKLIEDGLSRLFDAIGSAGGQSGGGLGSILAAVFGGGGPVPGFATGGSFKVGGSGGIDSQLMQFRATPGEMVDIRHGNDNGGRGSTNIFDMRGAVVTQDLLAQMNTIAAQGDIQVLGAVQKERAREQKARRYTVAR